jgi:hypothetical protein
MELSQNLHQEIRKAIEGGIRFMDRYWNPELPKYGARCNKTLNKEHFFLKTADETPKVN